MCQTLVRSVFCIQSMDLKIVLSHCKCLHTTCCLSLVNTLSGSPILFYTTSGIFPGAKDLTSDLSHPKHVPWQTACYGGWASCFHWKFQVDSAKFFPRKLACKLSLKWLLLTNTHFLTKWKIPCWSCTCGDADLNALCLSGQCNSA